MTSTARDESREIPSVKRDTWLLIIMAYFLLLIATFLFAFVDVWYFLRFLWLILSLLVGRKLWGNTRITSKEDIFREYRCYGIVLPSDLDFMFHMNNSKYLREMDFGRVGLAAHFGLRDVNRQLGASMALNAASVRYR